MKTEEMLDIEHKTIRLQLPWHMISRFAAIAYLRKISFNEVVQRGIRKYIDERGEVRYL